MDVALLDELMSTGDQLQSIDVAEVTSDLGSEDPPSSSCIDGPIFDILWVGPHQIAERPLMRDFNLSINRPDLIDGLDLRTESTMHAEDLAINDCSNGQVIEHLSTVLPRVRVAIFPINLIIKSINSRNLPE